jgi:uncharacterized protein (TIGR02246 family)
VLRIPDLLAPAAAMLLIGCTAPRPAPQDATASPADRAAIDKVHDAFLDAMRAGDCTAMVSGLAQDVVFAPPNVPNARGADGVRAWCEATFANFKTKAVSVSEREVVVAGDWAIESGNYDWTVTPAAAGAEMREQGGYVAIIHREPDGSWKVARDIWNSSQPLPATAGK